MKISKETLEILKNFSQINSNLAVNEGNKISTMTAHKHILAEAIVEENFPTFGIYDLPRFLGDISLFDEPEFSFKENHVLLKSGNRKSKIHFADEEFLVRPPKKSIKMPETTISFVLSQGDIDFIKKASATLNLEDMSVKSDGKKVFLNIHDKEDDGSDENSIEVAKSDGQKYKLFFKVDNLRMLPSSYKVSIGFASNGKGALSVFENQEIDLKYYIAVEADSEIDEAPKQA